MEKCVVCRREVRDRITCGKECNREYSKNSRKYRPKLLNKYYDLKYHLKHREKILSNLRKINSNDVVNIRNKLRTKAMLSGLQPVSVPRKDIEILVRKKQEGCVLCRSINKLHLDHIKRISSGGDIYNISNIQFLCDTCHKKKTQKENYCRLLREFEEMELELKRQGFLKGTGNHLKKKKYRKVKSNRRSTRKLGV